MNTPQPIDINTVELIRPYGQMVSDLFKVGKTLGNAHGNAMHAAIGICGEAGELFMANTQHNMIEEAGDSEFYLEALYQQFPMIDREIGEVLPLRPLVAVINGLMVNSTILLDAIKKGWVYNKALDIEKLDLWMGTHRHFLDNLYHHMGVSRHAVLYINQLKLIGPNGRYPDGKYSDAAAQARADKGGAQD